MFKILTCHQKDIILLGELETINDIHMQSPRIPFFKFTFFQRYTRESGHITSIVTDVGYGVT